MHFLCQVLFILADLCFDNNSYIVGFQMSRPSRPEDVWRDVWWLTWGLAKGQPGYRSYKEVPKTSDTSKWTM